MARCVALIPLLFATASFAAEPDPVFRWRRAVELPPVTETTLVAAPLDTHVFGHTRDEWPDVRLFDADGRPVAFEIRKVQAIIDGVRRESWTAQQTAAKFDAAAGLQIEVQLREKEPTPQGLRIVSPLGDFEHQVRVESSTDGQSWQPAGEPTLIFDYTRFVDARNDSVPLTAGDHRRFRLIIADVTAEQESQLLELHRRLRGGEETDRNERTVIARRPFRIDRVEFYRDVPRPQSVEIQTTDSPVPIESVEQRTREQQTVVSFTTQREPITALTVATAAENFSRRATLEADVEPDPDRWDWKPLATGTLTRFAVGNLRREELTIKFSDSRRTQYRLVIDNADSPPIPVTGLTATGPVYELAFLAEPHRSYELHYGSPDAIAGRFDTAALQAVMRTRQAPSPVTLAPPQENPHAPAPRGRMPWNDPRLLIGGIVLLTLGLGYVLYLAGRDLKTADRSPLDPPQ